uniref:Secreted protein n=1 Tax=Amblyomma americanum TaxID=6943 RepID=A0A0C9R6L5_AMBAM
MQRKQASCFLTFLVAIPLATGKMVNLTAVAERYIRELNATRQNITSWGLSLDYFYMAKNHSGAGHPITATVQNVTCLEEMKNYLGSDVIMIGSYLKLTDGMYCPFNISANITLPLHKGSRFEMANVTLSLHNRTGRLIRSPNQAPPTGKHVKKIKERCILSMTVVFNGTFAYETKSDGGNETQYIFEDVGNLNNTSQGLNRSGRNLIYVMHGNITRITYLKKSTFKHILL